MEFIWVAVGGAVGAASRYGVTQWTGNRLGWAFPWGTLTVNLVGSLVIGFLLAALTAKQADPAFRLLLVTGFLGGFTTFSSFSFETLALLEGRRWEAAALYVAASVLLGLAACGVGLMFGRMVTR